MAAEPEKTARREIRLVADSYWPAKGGVEQWAHGMAVHLSRRHSVKVITHAPGAPFHPRFIFFGKTELRRDDAGIAVEELGPHGIARLTLIALLAWRLPLIRKFLSNQLHDALYFFYERAFLIKMESLVASADIVHCFSTGYLAVCAGRACRRLCIPCIQSPPVHFGKWGDSPLLLETYARAQTIACLSEDFKRRFRERMPKASVPIVVVAVPVEPPAAAVEPAVPIPRPFVLFLARREPHKGLALLLDAFKSVPPPAVLVVAGPGEPIAAASGRVIDCGAVEEPVKQWLLEHCALLCMPSGEESFGIVYAEAMAHAKPIVALDRAPVNEIVLHGETGLLAPPGRPEMLAKAIMTILDDPTLARAMGEEGRKRFDERYEASKVMEKIMELYDSVLQQKSAFPRQMPRLIFPGKKGRHERS